MAQDFLLYSINYNFKNEKLDLLIIQFLLPFKNVRLTKNTNLGVRGYFLW